jgi:cytidine deaminase
VSVADRPADDRMEELVRAAREAMSRAYAPYSGFRVGAALLGADGSITQGCNVENAAYPSSICAERGAVMAAVAAGVRRFEQLVIATESDDPTPPCGQCRQVLVEFAPALPVASVTASGRVQRWSMAELLPNPFIPASLPSA